jgi:hypothetical protein
MVNEAFRAINASGVSELDWFALVTHGAEVNDAPTDMWLPHLRAFLAPNLDVREGSYTFDS